MAFIPFVYFIFLSSASPMSFPTAVPQFSTTMQSVKGEYVLNFFKVLSFYFSQSCWNVLAIFSICIVLFSFFNIIFWNNTPIVLEELF